MNSMTFGAISLRLKSRHELLVALHCATLSVRYRAQINLSRNSPVLFWFVVIRERRHSWLGLRMLLQLFKKHRDRLFELRIAVLAPRLRVHLHFKVRSDAFIFDSPMTFGIEEGKVGRVYAAAIYKEWISRVTDFAAPGSLTDQFSKSDMTKIPGNQVAARSRILIDEHGLRSEDSYAGFGHDLTVGRVPVIPELALEIGDDVIGCLPAAIVTIIHDHAIPPRLRKIVAIERRESALPGVGQIDVGDLATAQFRCLAHVSRNPIAMAELNIARDWNDHNIARIRAIRVGSHFQSNLLLSSIQEEAVNVIAGAQLSPVDREQVLAGFHFAAWLSERSA